MSPGLFLDNKKYISAKEASRMSGYSQDYIGQLARANKISSKRIGRNWYISEESILNYKDFANELGLLPEVPTPPVESFLPELKKKPEPVPPIPEIKIEKLDPACMSLFVAPSYVPNPRTLPISGVGKLLVPSLGVIFLGLALNANGIDIQKSLGKLVGNFGENLTANVSGTPSSQNKENLSSNFLAQALTQKSFPSPEQLRSAFRNFLSTPDVKVAPSGNTTVIVKETVREIPVKVISNSGLEVELRKLLADPSIASSLRGARGSDGDDGSTPDTSYLVTKDFLEGQIDALLDDAIDNPAEALRDRLAESIATGELSVSGSATFSDVSIEELLVSGETTFEDSASFSSTVNINSDLAVSGLANFTHTPTLPHAFTLWPAGTSNYADASIVINPVSAVADANLLSASVNGSIKFLVDAEGDIYGNNLILTGSTSTGSTVVGGNLEVQDNTTLGDAGTDTVVFNSKVNSNLTFATDNTYDFGASGANRARTGYFGTSVVSPSFVGALTGNASTATALETTRTIWGQNFNGSANVSGALSGATTGVFSTSVSTPSLITASGALGITPAAGSNLNINLSTTGDLAVNTDDFYVDTSTGNVGVGTTNPGRKLVVQDDTDGSSYPLRITSGDGSWVDNQEVGIEFSQTSTVLGRISNRLYNSGTADWGIGFTGYLGGLTSELMTIRGNGNVGIGTTNPAGKLEVVVASGGSVKVDDPTGASTTSNFLNVTGTLPSTLSAITSGVLYKIRTAGSSSQGISASRIELLAGYTGSSITRASYSYNEAAGTGTAAWTSGNANYGLIAQTEGTTTGHNVGLLGRTLKSSTLNMGVLGLSTTSTNSPALNIGTGSLALNATTNVAGFFGLMSTAPTLSSSAALIADNGSTTSDIFKARDNGTDVFNIIDGGNVGIGTTNPDTRLQVNGPTSSDIAKFVGSGGTTVIDQYGRVLVQGYNIELGQVNGVGGVGSTNTSRFDIGVNNSPKISVLNSGNIGIGTTNPGTKLDIWAANGDGMYVRDTSGNIGALAYMDGTAGVLQTRSAGTVTNEIKGSGIVYFNSGNVGIGTNNPNALFQVGSAGLRANSSGNLALLGGSVSLARGIQLSGSLSSSAVQRGIEMANLSTDTSATTAIENIFAGITTAAGSYTTGDVANVTLGGIIKGSGHTITRATGLAINDITAGTNNILLLLGGGSNVGTTFTGNYAIYNNTSKQSYLGSGNVGIGTTNPGAKLELEGTTGDGLIVDMNSNHIGLNVAGVRKWTQYVSGNDMRFFDSADRLTLQAGGNVGIGTTDPGAPLQVNVTASGSSATGTIFNTTGSSGGTGYDLLFKNGGTSTGIINHTLTSGGGSEFHFYTYAAGPTVHNLALKGGNVGIGTTAPGAKLDLRDGDFILTDADVAHGMTGINTTTTYGSLLVSDASAGGLKLRGLSDNSTTGLTLQGILGAEDPTDTVSALTFESYKKNGTSVQAVGSTETAFQFKNFTTNLMTILGSGNVGIGTISPDQPLEVENSGEFLLGWTRGGTSNNWALGADSTGTYIKDITGNTIVMNWEEGGNVGIGTTGPGARLEIRGANNSQFQFNDQAGSANLIIRELATDGWSLRSTSDEKFSIYDQGVGERLTIDNAGDVGIGTTDPNAALDIVGSQLRLQTNGAVINFSGGEAQITTPSNYVVDIDFDNNETDRVFKVRTNAGASELFRVQENGNVGIGTTPSYRLDVSNTSANDIAYFTGGNTGSLMIRNASSNLMSLQAQSGDSLSLETNGSATSRLFIDTDGKVGIGTSSPQYGLDVRVSMPSGTGAHISNPSATNPNGLYITLGASPDNNSQFLIRADDTTAPRFIVYSDGDVLNHDNSYGSLSDVRLKENISLAGDYLDLLKQVEIKKYSFISDNQEEADQLGVIAQELELIFPDLVNTGEDGYKSVAYSQFTPIIIKAIQELNTKVEALAGGDQSWFETANEFFEESIESIADGVAYMRGLVVESLTVGSPEKRTGITLYDEETGEPYCFSIKNGNEHVKDGECEIIEDEDYVQEEDAGGEESEPGDEEVIEGEVGSEEGGGEEALEGGGGEEVGGEGAEEGSEESPIEEEPGETENETPPEGSGEPTP